MYQICGQLEEQIQDRKAQHKVAGKQNYPTNPDQAFSVLESGLETLSTIPPPRPTSRP